MSFLNPFKTESNVVVSEEEFLTVEQTCRLLHVTRETLRRWEKQDKLQAYYLAGVENKVKPSDFRGKRYKLSDIQGLITPA